MPMIEPRLHWTPSLIGLSPPSFYGGFFGPLQPLGPSYTPRWRHLGDEGGWCLGHLSTSWRRQRRLRVGANDYGVFLEGRVLQEMLLCRFGRHHLRSVNGANPPRRLPQYQCCTVWVLGEDPSAAFLLLPRSQTRRPRPTSHAGGALPGTPPQHSSSLSRTPRSAAGPGGP